MNQYFLIDFNIFSLLLLIDYHKLLNTTLGFHIICTCRLLIVKVEQAWIEFQKQWFNNDVNHKCEL